MSDDKEPIGEIRFRAKAVKVGPHITDKADQWVYGYYVKSRGSFRIENDFGEWVINPSTVGEFIGKKDADGQEVYEHDVIAYEDKIKQGPSNVPVTVTKKIVVEYHTDRCGFYPFCDNFDYDGISFLSVYPNFRVVGNIRDNPELVPARERIGGGG